MNNYERLVAMIDESLKMHIDKSCNLAENIARDLVYEGVFVVDDRNKILELPYPIGTRLHRVTYPYRKGSKITSYTVKNFRTTGKRHKLQVEVQADNVPVKNWMDIDKFHTDYAEAERELKEILGGENV